MKQLSSTQLKQVQGGFPPAVVALIIVAGRHYGAKAIGMAVTGFVGGFVGGWLRGRFGHQGRP